MTIETVFWTQIASTLGFLVALFVLYRLLVEQKEATIQTQKENIAYLKDQLAEAKSQSPDTLAQKLANRVKLFEDEVKRLENDKSSTEEQIRAKEAELHDARAEAENLTQQVLSAHELLSDFRCPRCGAPLAEKAYHSEVVEYQGREIDVDHECTAYECGYQVVDGEVRGECKNVGRSPVARSTQ